MKRVLWSNAALANLQAIRAYIAQFNPSAATALAARLIEAANSLQYLPDRGRPVPGSDLRELLAVYPYIIRYRATPDQVFILRVRHGARRRDTT